jgi:hypothetical protein
LKIIQQLLSETIDPSKVRGNTSTENQDDQEQWFMVNVRSDDRTLLQRSFFQSETAIEDTMIVDSDTSCPIQPDSMSAAINEGTVALPFNRTPLVPQPSQFNDKYKDIQTLFDLTRDYYNYRLQGYSLHFKRYSDRIDESTLDPTVNFDTLAQTKQF